jgi:hypothetical protein
MSSCNHDLMRKTPETPVQSQRLGRYTSPALPDNQEGLSQMHKKIMLACMAIAAFAAFVVAPAASASPVLTENGVRVPATNPDGVNTKIIATNTGITKFTSAIEVQCTTASLTGELLKNTGTEIEGEVEAANAKFTGTGTNGDCTSNFFNAPALVTVNNNLCMRMSKGSDKVTTSGPCGGGNVAFTLTLTGQGPCKYETANVNGTVTTNATPATAVVSEEESKLVSGSFFCPTSGKLDMTFDLYTDDASETPLTVS